MASGLLSPNGLMSTCIAAKECFCFHDVISIVFSECQERVVGRWIGTPEMAAGISRVQKLA